MDGLRGRRIVITRAQHQTDDLASLLDSYGAIPLRYPCLQILPPSNPVPLKDAVNRLREGAFDWVILTSANTVDAIGAVLQHLSPAPLYAAVGPATAQTLSNLGLNAAPISPKIYSIKALVERLPDMHGAQVLLPQSELADPDLARLLTERGAHVTAVAAYTTGVGTGGIDLPRDLRDGNIDAITLASPSAFRHLLIRLRDEGGDPALLTSIPMACIGTTTAQAVIADGFTPAVIAKTHTAHGLIGALDAYFISTQESPHS